MSAPSITARLHRLLSDVQPTGSLLVVIGAHLFAADRNDPLYSVVRDIAWGGALLVEASPLIAHQLQHLLSMHNPLPRVPPERIVVSNVGIRDKLTGVEKRKFFTLTAHGADLPGW